MSGLLDEKKSLPPIQRIDKSAAAPSPDSDNPPETNENPLPIEAGQYVKEGKLAGQKSQASLRSSDDGGARGREINDTAVGRLLYLQWSFLSIIIEVLLIYVLYLLHTDEGITVPVGGQVFQQTVPVILELWMHICYIFTDLALSKGVAAYFAHELVQKRGYSLIVCGFIQSGLFAKIQFSGLLNFRSKYKKVLSRASILWLVHILFLILTFFASTAITISTTRYDSGSLLCVEYGQDGTPVDRGWPTIETQSGVAEFIFGTSLGLLSSEGHDVNTTLLTSPQLIDSCADGTNIQGNGFATNLATTCTCSASSSIADLIVAGVDASVASEMLEKHVAMSGGPGWTNNIQWDGAQSIVITTLISGGYLCGGSNYANKTVPVCTTNIASHKKAFIEISWMNDGVNVRSAPNAAKSVTITDDAKFDWLHTAVKNAFGDKVTSQKLPGFYPGTVNPLFWWTTPNLQTMSLSFLTGGIETSIAMMLKVGITRTYSVKGTTCTQNLEDLSKTTLNISSNGFTIGIIFTVFELFLSVASIIACIPWFIYKDPVIPALRLVSDRTYFNIMLCKNSTGNLLRMIGSTADRTDIWPKLDMEVRVGENIQTVSDPESGEIIMDKPKLVTHLSWTKCY